MDSGNRIETMIKNQVKKKNDQKLGKRKEQNLTKKKKAFSILQNR